MSDISKIRAKIEAACAADMELPEAVARDVSFHMTDWTDDLHRYAEFCDDPDRFSSQEAGDILLSFLLHVPNHIAAASKLYADMVVSDIFSVGSVGAVVKPE